MDLSNKEKIQTANALKRATSNLAVFDSSGNVLNGVYVWTDLAPAVKENPELMFAKCLVHPGSTTEKLICTQVEPPNDEKFEVPLTNAWNTNSQIDPMTYGDIGMLPQTSIPCVLDFLRHRFYKNQIYSTADPLMVSINPFKDLGNSGQDVIERYKRAKNLLDMPPHVYYTSRRALENLHDYKYSQTIIVSGESGAGKTQSANMMMRYFATGSGFSGGSHIQQVVMAFNPVLESFGNAKTIRNNNSSRFGRFMQLDVAAEGGIRYGSIVTFLLEKSRIVTQDDDERSYHIFYQLLKGANDQLRSKLKLRRIGEYEYLNDKCTEVNGVDDAKEFGLILNSFDQMKLTEEQKETVLSLLSGVLLLGNVQISGEEREGLTDASVITNENLLRECAELLYLDYDQLKYDLTMKKTMVGGGEIVSPRRKDESEVLKKSLSKAVYNKLFFWLVATVNKTIAPPEPFKFFIGLLDIFGFEVFKNNSLEQLFINITNEMLQTNFVNIVFKREAQLYADEGIACPNLEYESNSLVIEVLCGKTKSILSILEDQCLAPGGNDANLTSACNTQLSNNPKYVKSRQDKYFLIVHTIGPIQYCSDGFITKNKDLLTGELVKLVNSSSNPLVSELFMGDEVVSGKLAKGMLIGSQFMNQLDSLMTLINSTDPHFIRCISPNDKMMPMTWNSVRVILQLHALSVIEALQLRKLGFSYRRTFAQFNDQYAYLNLAVVKNSSLSDKDKAIKLVTESGLGTSDYAVGKTRMFLTRKAANNLTSIVRERLAKWAPLADLLEALLRRLQYQRELKKTVKSIVRLQAHLRRVLNEGERPAKLVKV